MTGLTLFAILVVLLQAPAFAQQAPPPGVSSKLPDYRVFGEATPEDAEAIGTLMRQFSEARQAGDAKRTAAFFADDLEWTNAFGDVVRGSDNLQRFLGWLFALDEKGTTEREAMEYRPVSIRYLGNDVAVVHGMTLSTRGEARSRRNNGGSSTR